MTVVELERTIGPWEQRQAWIVETMHVVRALFQQHEVPAELYARAKADESILEKMSRFGETVAEVHDLYGFRLVAEDFDAVERAAELIVRSFGETPTEKDMTIRGGALVFQAFRNYRKRDWAGVSPATAGGYNDAIHFNRKYQGNIVEFQIVTRPLFEKYCSSTAEESHAAFKARQAALHHGPTV